VLTISELASYAGVTVRAVRHYHAKGLLPEPRRDRSGYRRYGAEDVVALIKSRTLAGAGVPLARVRGLLAADGEEFAAAVQAIDGRLRAEMRERQHLRERIAQLAAGDSLALPPQVVAYLKRMRELGFPERLIEIERDSWILISAQMPDQVPGFITLKRGQIEHETLRRLYLDIGELVDCTPDDPRLPSLADRVVAFLEDVIAEVGDVEETPEQHISDDLVALLDAAFVEYLPCAPRLLELLEERGFIGWTNIRRIPAAPTHGYGHRPSSSPAT